MSWQSVLGHDAQQQAFERVWKSGRLAHAYLLVGPAGVGKRTFAVELARALLCEEARDELRACDRCSSCVLMSAGNHPDFLIVGKPPEKNELPIEVMRELGENFTLKPARGHGKVAILDDADDLNSASANCFLKTLEEPPKGSVILLIGTTPERQMTTILSRCQTVRFSPLPPELVDTVLRQQGVDDDALRADLVRAGAGSPGQALQLADPALWEFRGQLVRALGQPRVDACALAKNWIAFNEEAGKETAQQRQRTTGMLRLLANWFESILLVMHGVEPRWTNPSERAMLESLAARLHPEQCLDLLERTLAADSQTERYISLPLILEALTDALAAKLAA